MTKKTCPQCGHIQNVMTKAKRTVCSMCDSAIKLRALTVVFATVLMIAIIPAAYADISVTAIQENLTPEEQKVLDDIAKARADGTYIQPPEADFTATIQVYSEDVTTAIPFPVGDQYCGSVIFKMGIAEITCTYIGIAPVGQVWDLQASEWISESVIAEQAKKSEIESKAMALTPEEKQLQAVQNLVNNLKNKSNPTATDLQAIENYDIFSICMRGLEDTEAFQSRNSFVVPVESLQLVDGQWMLVIPEFENGNYDFGRNSGITGDLYMAAQECKAQIKLMGYTTPDHYRNMVMNEDDFQPTHQDQAKLDKALEEFGSVDFTDRQDGDALTEAAKSNFTICLSEHFSDKYKADVGCPSPYLGLYEVQEPSGFTLETAPPVINHDRYGTVCGLIPNGHIVNDIHWNYLEDLENRFNCWHHDRINGIMLFDPQKINQSMIDEQIAKYQESLK